MLKVSSYIKRPLIAVLAPLLQAYRSGHIYSALFGRAVSANKDALPWYTQPAVKFLIQQNFLDCTVLEFGGGQSTIWWSKNARSVTTFEDDEYWLRKCSINSGTNSKWHLIPKGLSGSELRNSIYECLAKKGGALPKFDVVIVDAMHRETLALLAFDLVEKDGIVIIDNSEGYGISELTREVDYMRIDFIGPANGVFSEHATSFFFTRECCHLSVRNPIECP